MLSLQTPVLAVLAICENQFPNRVCQRGGLLCEKITSDAVTSDFVSAMFPSSRSVSILSLIFKFICSSMEVRASLVVFLFTMMIVVVLFTHA